MSDDRIPELDGLRGIAILLVVVHHVNIIGQFGPFWPLTPIAEAGWIGVDLFFVLSGFLITGILRETRDHPRYWSRFAIRRALRILPLYVPFAVVCALVAWTLPPDRSIPGWWYFTFLQNWPIGLRGGTDGLGLITWSLAVEEQFYVLWPWWVLGCSRVTLERVLVGIVVASPFVRIACALEWSPSVAYMWTVCRMDALALGALASLWVVRPPSAVRTVAVALAPALVVGLVAGVLGGFADREPPGFVAVGYTFVAATFTSTLLFVRERRSVVVSRVLSWGPLAYVGKISFGLYLLHDIGILAAKTYVTLGIAPPNESVLAGVIYAIAGPVLAIGLAAVSWEYFEKRVLGYKDVLAP